MSEKLSDDQFIHTVILKNTCWHDIEVGGGDMSCCTKCHEWYPKNPAYSESLDLLAPVEQKAIEEFGERAYGFQLWKVRRTFLDSGWSETDYPLLTDIATLPADVRAPALRSLWESKGGGE